MGARLTWLATIVFVCALAAPAHAYVYWTDGNAGTIGRANLDGSGVVTDFITGATSPSGIAVGEEHVYWTTGDAIGRANLDGSDVNHGFITGVSPTSVAVDGSYIYWTGANAIGRAPLDGSQVDDGFITSGAGASSVAVNDLGVYWTAADGIWRANLDGSGVETMGPGVDARGLAVDDSRIAWASDAGVQRAALDAIATPEDVSTVGARSVALLGRHVYWTAAGAIGRFDGTTAHASLIVAGDPEMVAVDGGPPGTASASASSLDFGFESIGALGPLRTLTLTNTGPGTLEVDLARVTGTHADDFLLGRDTCSGALLVMEQTCTVAVVFAPDDVGERQATLRITSNDAASPLDVALLGTGEDPEPQGFDDFPDFDEPEEDFDEPRDVPDRPRLVTCRIVEVTAGGRKVERRRCRARRVRGTPNFATTGAAHATLTRRGIVYATGTARASRVVLDLHRRVRAGRYTLTLRRGNDVVRRMRIRIRR